MSPDNPFGILLSPEKVEEFAVRETAKKAERQVEAELPIRLAWSDPTHGIWLYHADCLAMLDRIAARYPGGIFDVIFADPPYFLSNGGITCHAGRMVSVNKGDWDRSRGPEENHNFNREWLVRCQRVLKPSGTIWVSGTAHVIHSIGFAMQQLGFKLLNDIVWVKPNPPPNLSCRYFTHASETIIWAAKNEKSKHRFDYDLLKRLNDGKQVKSVWTFPPPESEYVWSILPPKSDEKRYGKHPTQKPVALLERIIQASTGKGDLILDPFLGSGTTLVAAARLERRGVGIDLDESYVGVAVKRIEDAIRDKGLFAEHRTAPRRGLTKATVS